MEYSITRTRPEYVTSTLKNTTLQMKSAAFGRLLSFFNDAPEVLFFPEEVIGRLRRLSVSELESIDFGEGEAAADELRDLGVISCAPAEHPEDGAVEGDVLPHDGDHPAVRVRRRHDVTCCRDNS